MGAAAPRGVAWSDSFALRASESRFRLLSENAADVVILVDSRGRITYRFRT